MPGSVLFGVLPSSPQILIVGSPMTNPEVPDLCSGTCSHTKYMLFSAIYRYCFIATKITRQSTIDDNGTSATIALQLKVRYPKYAVSILSLMVTKTYPRLPLPRNSTVYFPWHWEVGWNSTRVVVVGPSLCPSRRGGKSQGGTPSSLGGVPPTSLRGGKYP